jgi:hypothetical protein
MLIDLVGKGLNLVAKILGANTKVAEAVNTIQDALASSPEAQIELKKMQMQELQLVIDAEKDIRDLYKIEVQSPHGFVRNARPAMLWLCGSLLALNFGVVPFFNTVATWFGWTPVVLTFPDLPEPLYWLIATTFGFYTGGRTYEKVKGKS